MKNFNDMYLKEKIRNLGLNPDDPAFLNDPRYKKIKNIKFLAGNMGGTITFGKTGLETVFQDLRRGVLTSEPKRITLQ